MPFAAVTKDDFTWNDCQLAALDRAATTHFKDRQSDIFSQQMAVFRAVFAAILFDLMPQDVVKNYFNESVIFFIIYLKHLLRLCIQLFVLYKLIALEKNPTKP